jgi:hypothetical protein
MGFWSGLANGIGSGISGAWDKITGDPGADAEKARKAQLYQQAGAAGGFADQAQGSYQALGNDAAGQRAYLARLASGQDSVSAEQLRQGVQRNQAVQQSIAAGASPQNTAGAARTAAIQSARIGSGMAGQAALAGLQERQQAHQALTNSILTQRGQDMSATLGSRQAAIGGYGAGQAGAPEKSFLERIGPAIQGGASAYAASDPRLKTGLRDGRPGARDALVALAAAGPKQFEYRQPAIDGAGTKLGTTTTDLKRAGLGQAVIPSARGEMVDAAQLALANTAMIAELARRSKSGGEHPGIVVMAGDKGAVDSQAELLRRRAMLRGAAPYRRPGDHSADRGDGGGYSSDAGGQ